MHQEIHLPTNLRIRRYQYELRSAEVGRRPGAAAMVYLYGKTNDLIGAIAFFDTPDAARAPVEQDNGIVTASMPATMLPYVIDMLRHEKPVTFCWSEQTSSLRLTTDDEPVGEEELKRLFSFLYI